MAGEDVLLVTVPGALEAPLALQKMAESGQFDALIALGAVIRGETYHFELVSNESGAGITRVGLDFNIAIANGILTTDTDAQAHARTREKGRDCARAAVANGAVAIQPGAMDWIGLVMVCFVLPAVICWAIGLLCRRLGWIREGDLKLD